MKSEAGQIIQGHALGKGDATSPYTVEDNDSTVEFTEAGTVTCGFSGGGTSSTTVLAGSRYPIGEGVITITFAGTFSIG